MTKRENALAFLFDSCHARQNYISSSWSTPTYPVLYIELEGKICGMLLQQLHQSSRYHSQGITQLAQESLGQLKAGPAIDGRSQPPVLEWLLRSNALFNIYI